ncbi:MAG TPA: hypothetical protein VKA53_05270 [Thermoanaerobaculia bacterium]|nr:hypothetical protein [Thermoanaerobaculia bacterium]
MERSNLVVGLALVLAVTGCGGHDPSPSNRLAPPSPSGEREVRERSPAASTGHRRAAPSRAKTWSLVIDQPGLPKLSGSLVMAAPMPGGVTQYAFVGGGQMSNLMIKGAAPYTPGTYEPYSLSIAFTERKISCSTSILDRRGHVVVKIERRAGGEVHGAIDGTVICSPLGKSSGERTQAKIHGWFDH